MKPKINTGLLRRLQPTKFPTQKSGTSKGTACGRYIRRQGKGRLSRAGGKWNLQYINASRYSKTERQNGKISERSGVKAEARRPAVNYANAVKSIGLAILPKEFSEQILAREKQEIIGHRIVMSMYGGWNEGFVLTDIHFRSGLILLDSVIEVTAGWFRTIVPKLPDAQERELSACDGDVGVYFSKAGSIETGKLLRLLITQNMDLHTWLWRVQYSVRQVLRTGPVTLFEGHISSPYYPTFHPISNIDD